jgi:hypothetical protein
MAMPLLRLMLVANANPLNDKVIADDRRPDHRS